MRRICLLSTLLLLISIHGWSQVTDMGGPLGWKDKVPTVTLPLEVMPAFDMTQQLYEDSVNNSFKSGPWRFGHNHSVDLDLGNSGVWTTLPNGDRLWRIGIESTGALTINLIFEEFDLPKGAFVYLYDNNQTNRVGAYTDRNNNPEQKLGTELVHGDNIIVEYFEPEAVQGQGTLKIGTVTHGYRELGTYADKLGNELYMKALNSSGDCNIDVNCPLGAAWNDQIRSVAMIVVGGNGICTGALINNTSCDFTPYFLTANHCYSGSIATWSFRFNWESPPGTESCATAVNSVDPGPPYDQTANGGTVRANDSGSDFLLLEMNLSLAEAQTWNVFFAGWDNSEAIPTQVTGIHHPSGDVKKICQDNGAVFDTWNFNGDPNTQVWRVNDWTEGVTEPGSSGSPLFDQNGRIIGDLSGGTAACAGTNDNGGYDGYGRFGISWNGGGSAATRVRDWLDPLNTSTTNDGCDPNAPAGMDDTGINGIITPDGTICSGSFDPEVTMRNYGSNTVTSATITYDIDGGTAQIFNWTGSLASGASINVTLPTMSSTNGAHTFNAATSLPNGNTDSNAANDGSSNPFVLVIGGQSIDFTLDVDCWGSETTWTVQQGATVLYSGGPYTDVGPGGAATINETWCLSVGCYDFIINDSYGDGMYGSQYGSCTVDGNYSIDQGATQLATIIAANSDYGSQEINNFCVTCTLDDATFNYSAASYCLNDSDPTPTITGLPGGTFSSTAGLSINTSTGALDVSASSPGTYTVTYTTTGPCTNSSNVSVTINALDDASFNYGAASYCVADPDPTATITGLPGGTFSSTAGLSLNASTGAIDVSLSTPGTYTITYTTAGTCPNSSGVSVTITSLDDASFNYGAPSYCSNDSDPSPTITGAAGGTFSSTPGLSLNASTGAIDVSLSAPGTYTITYTTAGTCSNSSGVSVTINALDDASFNYSASSYCSNDSDPTPTITGAAGGTFSSTAGLSLNASTGAIDVSLSTPGTYTITYTTAGTCPNSSGVSVTINALDDASFNYSAASYCLADPDPTATITGLPGGTFSSTAGLSLNASTGAIDVSLSTPGTYTITYTTAGTCPNSSGVSVTITSLDDASFNYGAPSYCSNDSDPSPTITGVAGGTFSSTAGLSLNTSTGAIDVSLSTPGTYTITYTTAGTCSNSSGVSVTINALDDASFNYSAASYCSNDSDPTPTITGAAGGTFSSTAGLSLNASTGALDVSASSPGTYTVTYTTSGPCTNSSNVSVTINALDDASFNYGAASYCVADPDPTATITGLPGGTFSSTAGLSLNASTGAIDVSLSTPGTYTITYTTAGTCPNSSGVSVTITSLDDASFNYGAPSYCSNDPDPTPTITGVAGGTFSSTAGLLINASTGALDVSASTPGTYSVTYTTSGPCANSSNVSVTINALDDASFNYGAASYCVADPDPTPTITGVAGGTFSSTAGLSINASTGAIDVSLSSPGTYTVTYTTSGPCTNSSNVSVTINALDDASFNYGAASYCVADPDPTPTITGVAGGTFSSTAGLLINTSTGALDVSASSPGTYTITYTTIGACSNSSGVSVTITSLDDASFNYGATGYCVDGIDPTPTITGVAGGTFSSTAGLSINTSTGVIDVSASTPGTYTVTYATIGACANSSGVSVSINALPTVTFVAPADVCPGSAVLTGQGGGLPAGGVYSGPGVGDDGNGMTYSFDPAVAGTGIHIITYTFTDANGCSASDNDNVEVGDAIDPATPTLADVTGDCSATATAPSTTDNCSGTITGTTTDPITYTGQGTYTINWLFDDGNGNTITVPQTVIVDDMLAPVPDNSSLSDVSEVCEVTSLTPPTATDNCAGAVTVTSDAVFPITFIGTTVVTWTYDDGNGNTSTQTQNVIVSGIDATATLNANGYTISSNNASASAYQWINCSDNSVIVGETNIDFSATANGDYAVIVTEGSCTDTSACITVSTLDIGDILYEDFVLYPNPTATGVFTITYEGVIQKVDVVDMLGRIISLPMDVDTNVIDGSELAPGKYMVRLYTDSKTILQQEVVVIK